MKARHAAALKCSMDLRVREALVLEINATGHMVLEGFGAEWATSTIPGMAIRVGDVVLATATADGRCLVLGVSRPAHPTGDVVFRAPSGRIVVEAGTDLELRAARAVRIESDNIEVTANDASLHAREASIIADVIRTTADEVATTVGRWELGARRIVERAVDVVRAYEGGVHLTTGRAHTVVREAYDLVAKRTSIASEEDTTIDGKRVLLG